MKWRLILLIALGAALETVFIVVAGLPTTHSAAGSLVLWLLVAFVLHVMAIAAATRWTHGRAAQILVIGFALLFRLTLLGVEGRPCFPDSDAYRYLWDGGVTAAGVNPYSFAPQEVLEHSPTTDGKLAVLRGMADREPYRRILPEVTYPAVPTIYPPATQLAFAAAAFIAPGRLAAWKVLLFLFDGLTLLWIALTLKSVGRRPEWLIVYAWCPLVVAEFAYAGHHDAIAVSFVALASLLLTRQKPWSAGAALGVAVLAKVFPIVLLPLFVRRLGWRCLVGALLVGAILTAPFAGAGSGLVRGLGIYAVGWRFNAGLFDLIERVVPTSASARVVAGLGVIAVAWWASRHRGDPCRLMLIVLASLLALSPVLDPWYVTWIVPLLCVVPFWPLVLLTGTVAVHYTYFVEFRHPGWARPLEFGPVAVAILVELVRWRRLRARLRDHPGPERGGGTSQGAGGVDSGVDP